MAADRLNEFHRLSPKLHKMRKRDGAYFWELFQDMAKSHRYLEYFMVESWLEHLRQHDRVSVSDRALQEKIDACLSAPGAELVTHYLAARWPSVTARG